MCVARRILLSSSLYSSIPKRRLEIHHPLFVHFKEEDFGLIDPLTRIYTFVASHTSSGNLSSIKEDFQVLPYQNRTHALEAVLQSLVFVGLPKVLNACATLQQANLLPRKEDLLVESEIGCQLGDSISSLDVSKLSENDKFQVRGHDTFSKVYSSAAEKLSTRIRAFHPDLETWVMDFGYGRILSRPLLSLYQRELCAIAALAGQSVAPQLVSHLRGALQVGASKEQVHSILKQTHLLFSSRAQEEVDAVWMTFERSRAAL
ncbi:hypothetical protein Gasu2_03470 [Galdieria sulphuraria]|uniref:4-carboxymuconolactone decarboxylase n=1 Tax=Galdieria sulphuraria TaxID=130081 RepID=M2Y072_GALSU|nr:4-carboxymuconolactone decarboxylase [Galdieria sulphuraria]EME29288.1 4-carboxymuconolactone decarboxylase [Galdieria sulphuraria]GJD05903.1 hypothetical protein Gasu2_03470 [Galdieria sulphuraria]|eukprot:XP_005705808.1 4-carboxymuconolactone decarboxylase [Galdieria sulphuraria]